MPTHATGDKDDTDKKEDASQQRQRPGELIERPDRRCQRLLTAVCVDEVLVDRVSVLAKRDLCCELIAHLVCH